MFYRNRDLEKEMRLFKLLCGVLFLSILWGFTAKEDPTVYLIGDSTCADKTLDDNPEHGWGQIFPLFFERALHIENHAQNGRSTKSFIKEGRWQKVLDKLKAGDYVFIQFGHNDSKKEDTNRYAEPHTLYKQNLEKFIKETRAKGANPILLTPVNRRKFNKEGKLVDQHGDYPVVVREVAQETQTPLIDVHKKSFDVFNKFGEEGTKKIFLTTVDSNVYKAIPKGRTDNTHFTRFGAIEVAKMVIEGLKEINSPLAYYLLNKTPEFSYEADRKIVALDYFYNHEMKKGSDGKEYQYHYVWEDREYSGFWELGNLFENHGAAISEVKDAPSAEELKKISIYIIVDPDIPKENPKPNYIDEPAITNIVNWVKDGGVLAVMTNDTGNCEFKHVNELMKNFGIEFNETSINRVKGKEYKTGAIENLPEHPVFKDVKKIYLKEISTIKTSKQAQPILIANKNNIIAVSKFGKGLVFAVGDPWIYNEYIDNRKIPIEFNNWQAAQNLVKWLLENAKNVR